VDRLFSTIVGEEEESGMASALATMTVPSSAEEVEGGVLASLPVLMWVTIPLLGYITGVAQGTCTTAIFSSGRQPQQSELHQMHNNLLMAMVLSKAKLLWVGIVVLLPASRGSIVRVCRQNRIGGQKSSNSST